MKYIDAELLRKEIEEERKSIEGLFIEGDNTFYDGQDDAYNHTLALIDSLQQERPEVDLKKEIKEWVDLMVGASFPEQDGDFISEEDYRSVIRQTALHFYELGQLEMRHRITNPEYNAKVVEQLKSEYPARKEG
jgi:hypothetical protein